MATDTSEQATDRRLPETVAFMFTALGIFLSVFVIVLLWNTISESGFEGLVALAAFAPTAVLALASGITGYQRARQSSKVRSFSIVAGSVLGIAVTVATYLMATTPPASRQIGLLNIVFVVCAGIFFMLVAVPSRTLFKEQDK